MDGYPVAFDVDYPDTLNRWTTGFRFILVIPLVILLALLGSSTIGVRLLLLGGTSVLFLPTVALLVLRHKYPRWWFDFALGLLRLEARITAYFLLLRDEYPSVDEEQHVHVDVPYPNADPDLNRWLPLVKWLLALPHYIVLLVLDLAAWVVAIIAWFAILFTGRYPEALFRFVVNVLRWNLNVAAYAILLTTDRYPPFQLGP
ncbi:MAG TPA: DUF4389 domain-containing protein [Acidimicrobiia bacterium]|nr:DUF4389 domain-containing protein [Acidimicrobiia bacterium]